ncbi:MAG: DUF6311 domain-containing protein [Kofleriaceae bacterium]
MAGERKFHRASAQLDRVWSAPASSRAAYAAAAVIGLAMLLIVYGPGFVLGTSAYWDMPTFDHRTYLMGYRYFLAEPWHWPVFESTTINVPHTQSIAFNDSVPLWAFVHKVVATVIPPWRGPSSHSFLGLWYALASMLQAAFGVAVLRALGHRTWAATIVTSLFFLAIPAWTFRVLPASLYAHFLVLWALALYLKIPPTAPARARVSQLAQLAVAALLNPYLTVMSLGVFVASLLRGRAWRSAAAWFAAGCAVVLAALGFAGYFAAEATASLAGFNEASANLLGPVMPRRSGWFGEALWVDPTGTQYEGMCYLGLGLIVLVAVFGWRVREVAATVRRHAALAVVLGGTAVLTLSNHIHLGSVRVLAYPIPHALHWIPDQFRAPGRFSWLPMYVVVVFLLARGFTAFSSGWKRLILPALAIVQLVDVTPDWRAWSKYTGAPHLVQLDVAGWRTLFAGSTAIEIYPAHSCNSDESYEIGTRIQYLASYRALQINGVSSSRSARDCYADFARLRALEPRAGTTYVFLSPMAGVASELAAGGLPCAGFEFGTVCHPDRALIESLRWRPAAPPVALGFGDKLDAAEPTGRHLGPGWSYTTDHHSRWTDGEVSQLVVRLTGTPPARPALWIEAAAYLCKHRVAQDVDVSLAGVAIGTLHFDQHTNQLAARGLAIPDPALLAQSPLEISLRPRDSRSPFALRCRGTDYVRRGVEVGKVWIGSVP